MWQSKENRNRLTTQLSDRAELHILSARITFQWKCISFGNPLFFLNSDFFYCHSHIDLFSEKCQGGSSGEGS